MNITRIETGIKFEGNNLLNIFKDVSNDNNRNEFIYKVSNKCKNTIIICNFKEHCNYFKRTYDCQYIDSNYYKITPISNVITLTYNKLKDIVNDDYNYFENYETVIFAGIIKKLEFLKLMKIKKIYDLIDDNIFLRRISNLRLK